MSRGRSFAPSRSGSVLTPLNKPVEIRMMVTQEQAFAMKRIALGVDRLSFLVSESGALLTALMHEAKVTDISISDDTLERLAPMIPRLMREPRDEKDGGGIRLYFAPEQKDDGTGQEAEPA